MVKLLIVGCGDIGCRLAALALAQGVTVSALVRSAAAAERVRRLGIEPLLADLDRALEPGGISTRGAVVCYLVPPPEEGEEDPRMSRFCAAIPPGEEPVKIVYISTSGVYGDCGGEVVTEERPPQPQTPRARRRLAAERALGDWGRRRGVAVVILRVPGIYGPGRLPVDKLREGYPVLRPEEAPFTNRIHADDLARVCLAAGRKGKGGEIFNVSDGEQSTMTDYFNAVADACGLPRPPQVSLAEARARMSPLMLSYLGESRRLDNSRMLARLGVRLRYPTLHEGLKASLG